MALNATIEHNPRTHNFISILYISPFPLYTLDTCTDNHTAQVEDVHCLENGPHGILLKKMGC